MKEFTFIVISYNQDKYIIEHLNSIKLIIEQYGSGIQTDLILADDCSNDDTVCKYKQWTEENRSLFRNVLVSSTDFSKGIVGNILSTLQLIQTEDFKFLAADDRYRLFDIYNVFDSLEDNILITHISPFGVNDNVIKDDIDVRFMILKDYYNHNKIDRLLKIDNYIAAPGVFIPGRYIFDQEFINYLQNYTYIEDYPMWMYLIVNKKFPVIVQDCKYVDYRIGSGVSTNNNNKYRQQYKQERDRIYKKHKIKYHLLPAYVNPYCYWMRILRWKARMRLATSVESDNR